MTTVKHSAKPLLLSIPEKGLTLRWEAGSVSLEIGDGQSITIPAVGPQPHIDGVHRYAPVPSGIEHEDGATVVRWEQSLRQGPVERVWGEVRFASDGLQFLTSYRARTQHVLGGWNLLPEGSQCTLDCVNNLWNSPAVKDNFLALPLKEAAETTTGGANRIWAPHVSAISFCSEECSVLLGVPELTPAFGLNFQGDGAGRCAAWLDFGGEHGVEVQAGEQVDSPSVVWRVTHDLSSEKVMGAFFETFVHDNALVSQLAEHWRKPWYCTWTDQYPMNENRHGSDLDRIALLDEAFVRRSVDRIESEQLPIGTIVIDDGWQTHRGDWNVDRRKFPDLRRLVDDLHGRGLSVMLWWAPLCFDKDAEIVHHDWMFCEGLDAYGERRLDYSSPRVQHEYLEPLMRQFFSADAGCWNVDGVKIDFMADRNHPGADVADRQWHGQELYLLNFYRLVWELAHQHKDDVCIYGTAQHPTFAAYQNVFGLEETYTPECHWIPSRGHLQSTLMPGTAVTAHFNYFCDAAEPFMRHCSAWDIIPQIPPLFEDLAGYRPDALYFSMLRQSMTRFK